MAMKKHRPMTSGMALVPPAEEALPETGVSFGPTLRAAFGLENDMLAWWDIVTRPTFKVDPAFDNYTTTKSSPYWDNYRDRFIGAVSQDHWDSIAARIEKEEKQKAILGAASAPAALAATLMAGLASPAMLLPGLTPLRGVRGIAAAAGLGALGAGVQEVPLQLAQETRTFEEGLMSLAAGTILGGLIGGAAQAIGLPRAIGQVYEDVSRAFRNDMARARDAGAIPTPRFQDKAGAPIKLYHGTPFNFPQFDLRRGGKSTGTDAGKQGVFFTTDRRIAESYAVPTQQYPEWIPSWYRRFNEALLPSLRMAPSEGEGRVAEAYLDVTRVKTLPGEMFNDLDEKGFAAVMREALREARAEGFQAVRFRGLEDAGFDEAAEGIQSDVVVVFEPDKIIPAEQLNGREFVHVEQEGPLIRTPSASPTTDFAEGTPSSVGAAAVPPEPSAGSFTDASRIAWLGKISPVVQTIAQSTFPTARRMMSRLSTAGLRFEGNANFIPAQAGGTVEANVGIYDAFIAKLVRIQDEHYADYLYQGKTKPSFAPSGRAALRSAFRFTGEKMTREEFNSEVSRAMFTGDMHPVEQVASAAKLLRTEVYDPILAEAKAVGLFEEGDLFDDASYLARMYDMNKIDANPEVFVRKIAAHFEKLLQDEVARASDRLRSQKAILDEYLDDVQADADTVAARRAEFQARLDAMEETDEEAQLLALRREQRSLRPRRESGRSYAEMEANKARLAEIKEEIKALEKRLGPQLDEKRRLRRRLRNLNRSFIAVEEKRAKKLDRVVRAEEAALASLSGVLRKGRRLQRDMNKLDKRKLQKEVKNLITRFANLDDMNQRRQARLAALYQRTDGKPVQAEDGSWAYPGDEIQSRIDATFTRMQDIEARLIDTEDLLDNRDVLMELLDELAHEALEGVNQLNLARGARIARLEEAAAKLTPEQVAERIEATRARFRRREAAVNERFRVRGIDDFSYEDGNAAVAAVARARAEDAVGKIGKYNNRVSGLHILGEERGSELARVLSIPSTEIFDFLITDIERVTRNYVRQVAADIELKRAFGDVDAKQAFKELEEEFFAVQRRLEESGASEAEKDHVSKEYRKHVRNIAASISRLRHTWGIPENPDGFVARGGKVLLDLATMRFMGSVAVSSIPDLSRLVVKHGISRTWRNAFWPMIQNFKQFQLSAREIKLAGGALDPIIHSRAMAFADILDENIGHSLPERVTHTMATKIGLIAGFDYWTSWMKQIAGVLDTGRVMDSIDLVVNGGGTRAEIAEATRYLAELGYNADLAQRTWDQVQAGGGNRVNGLWMPNTEDWTDPDLVRTFRAAIRQANNNTIITPGLEVPLMANAGIGSRLLFQFKSFALASHTKTLMAGLQQRDMALVNGVLTSLALGALSYYIWAVTSGGDAEEKMMKADWDRWLDEAIARSGLTGAFSEVQRIAERIPLTAPYANFSGEQTTRRAGASLVEAVLGPSFDTLSTTANVVSGIDDPTQSTVRQFVNLLPFNNVFYLKQLFRLIEDSLAADLPERRERK